MLARLAAMTAFRVLVLGGYGFFGRRLVERLARQPGLHILVAGRSHSRAQACIEALPPGLPGRLEPVGLDARADGLADTLRRLAPEVLVDAAGPFHDADHRVPAACIAAGVDAIDLADTPAYVAGSAALDAQARAAGVLVASGASSVPALSTAVADELAHGLGSVQAIDIGISPGNRTERGLSTVRSILSYCGQPIACSGGRAVRGWSGRWERVYPSPVGARLLSPCDVPDLTLLPGRYPGTPAVRFGAGLELRFLHRGMNAMAWMARAGLVRDWSRHARWLLWLSDRFRHWGSEDGAMHVDLRGTDAGGRAVVRSWTLVAAAGHGPYVPTLAAAALVRRLRAGRPRTGAGPCLGLLTLQDVAREMDGLAIRMQVEA